MAHSGAAHLVLVLLVVAGVGQRGAGAVPRVAEDTFDEELFLKELPDGKVYAHFQFTTQWNMSLDSIDAFIHFRLFPKSLGEVLRQFLVRELHLSLTQGLWRHEKWGYPVVDAPPGAELWAWFLDKQSNVDTAWTDLTHVLSGMFCASINFMDLKSTVTPTLSFRPAGVTTHDYDRRYAKHTRYASLPRETVCTENLTPWKKLLPCGSKAGVSALFNAIRLYDTAYHSLGIHFRPVCMDEGCGVTGIELAQTLSVVIDPVVIYSSIGGKWDWSLKKLFGRMITSTCALASTSLVYVDVGSNTTELVLSPTPDRVAATTHGGSNGAPVRYAVYEIEQHVNANRVLNLDVKHSQAFSAGPIQPPVLTATQFQTGSGQSAGGIMCLLTNHDAAESLVVIYQAVVPWFIRTYLHTLRLDTFPIGSVGLPIVGSGGAAGSQGVKLEPLHVHFEPGRDRQRPFLLELVARLPPASVTRLGVQFERALLRWLEYPPDANHGFYIGSAVVSALLPPGGGRGNYTAPAPNQTRIGSIFYDSSNPDARHAGLMPARGAFVRLHTESLLVTLPTPDFSMPYNVICLACTVLAIVFGSVHNLTTRKFVPLDPVKHRGVVSRVRDWAGVAWRRVARRKEAVVAVGEGDGDEKEGAGGEGDKREVAGEGVGSEGGGVGEDVDAIMTGTQRIRNATKD